MQLVTLVGSLRKGSFNAAIARALPSLAPAGVTVTALGSVGDFPLYDADLQEQGLPEPVQAMAQRIAAANGVIIVTPEYNYSVPGRTQERDRLAVPCFAPALRRKTSCDWIGIPWHARGIPRLI